MNSDGKDQADQQDCYRARLDDGELIMEPFCACGQALNEDYFCDRCQRKCRCEHVICRDQATLEKVRQFILKASQFSGFSASLGPEA